MRHARSGLGRRMPGPAQEDGRTADAIGRTASLARVGDPASSSPRPRPSAAGAGCATRAQWPGRPSPRAGAGGKPTAAAAGRSASFARSGDPAPAAGHGRGFGRGSGMRHARSVARTAFDTSRRWRQAHSRRGRPVCLIRALRRSRPRCRPRPRLRLRERDAPRARSGPDGLRHEPVPEASPQPPRPAGLLHSRAQAIPLPLSATAEASAAGAGCATRAQWPGRLRHEPALEASPQPPRPAGLPHSRAQAIPPPLSATAEAASRLASVVLTASEGARRRGICDGHGKAKAEGHGAAARLPERAVVLRPHRALRYKRARANPPRHAMATATSTAESHGSRGAVAQPAAACEGHDHVDSREPRSRGAVVDSSFMRQRLTRRLDGFGTSIFAEMTALARRYGAVNLGQGYPDFDGPEFVKRAAAEALAAGHNQYAPMPGAAGAAAGRGRSPAPLLRDRARRRGGGHDPRGRHRGAVRDARRAARPRRRGVVFEPFYDAYLPGIALAQAKAVVVPLAPPAFHLDADALEAAVSPRTRVLVLNSPEQPRRARVHARGARGDRRDLPSGTTWWWSRTRSTSTSSSTASTCRSPRCPGCASGRSPSPPPARPSASRAGRSAGPAPRPSSPPRCARCTSS